MVLDLIIEIPVVIAKLIAEYTAYRRDRRKEDDILVRRTLEREIGKAAEHIKNIMEQLYEKGQKAEIKKLKTVKDELDVFRSEINLSIVGHMYRFFSVQDVRSPKENDIKRLVDFDAQMCERLVNVTVAMDAVETKVIDGEEVDLSREFLKIRQYITQIRNVYKERENFLRGWK
jgi:hypothetical protein